MGTVGSFQIKIDSEIKSKDFDDVEDSEAIRLRKLTYEQKKKENAAGKVLMKLRKKEAARETKEIKRLGSIIVDLVKSKQLTTEYQKGRFGVEDYKRNRFFLPNKKFDVDYIEIKNINFSRNSDLRKPEPVYVAVTFDWTNPAQKQMGSAKETYEAIWMGDFWKVAPVG
jgi:hypothetical protein